MSKLRRAVFFGGAALTGLVIAASIVAVDLYRSGSNGKDAAGPSSLVQAPLEQRFAVLDRAHSNQCGLVSVDLFRLTPAQRAIYDQAVKLSDKGGPCCCHCWRWAAFEGQAEFLIARRGYGAQQIANVWGLEDGCGGPSHAHRI